MQGYCRPLYKQLSLFIAGMLRTCVNRSVQILRTSSNFLSVCVLWTHVCTASFLCVISFGIADLCTNSQFFFVFFFIMEYCDLCIKAPFLVCCAVDLCMHSFCSLFCFISFGIADLCINNFFFSMGYCDLCAKAPFVVSVRVLWNCT